eukprot:13736511-Alexandrium_andersonii.AAC.1
MEQWPWDERFKVHNQCDGKCEPGLKLQSSLVNVVIHAVGSARLAKLASEGSDGYDDGCDDGCGGGCGDGCGRWLWRWL